MIEIIKWDHHYLWLLKQVSLKMQSAEILWQWFSDESLIVKQIEETERETVDENQTALHYAAKNDPTAFKLSAFINDRDEVESSLFVTQFTRKFNKIDYQIILLVLYPSFKGAVSPGNFKNKRFLFDACHLTFRSIVSAFVCILSVWKSLPRRQVLRVVKGFSVTRELGIFFRETWNQKFNSRESWLRAFPWLVNWIIIFPWTWNQKFNSRESWSRAFLWLVILIIIFPPETWNQNLIFLELWSSPALIKQLVRPPL